MSRHVVLAVSDRYEKTYLDFKRIAAVLESRGIRSHVVYHRWNAEVPLTWLWSRPTISLIPVGKSERKLLPGRLFAGRRINKIEEYSILQDAGVPIPKWTEITPSLSLAPEEWGPYVVSKPSKSLHGAEVRIRKTSRVHYVAPADFPEEHPGRKGPMIAQTFVYTGEWPITYRVVTLFGKVLLCYRQVTCHRGVPLKSRYAFTDGISIVSNTKTMEVTLDADEQVMNLASSAHDAAFPEIPLLQFDIARDAETGMLFVLECHPWEKFWPFAHGQSFNIQKQNGVDFDNQFGAIERAGHAIADRVLKLLA